jgi:hypothetical protein
MAQHWKCCVGQLTVGSNPTSSVISKEAPDCDESGASFRLGEDKQVLALDRVSSRAELNY